MATVASRPQIVELEPQVRSITNRDVVVCMKVPLAARKCAAQFFHDLIGRRRLQPGFAEVPHDIRFPFAIYTSPSVTLEAQNPQSAVAGVVAAHRAGAATFVMFALP